MNRSFWLLRGLKFLFFAALFVALIGYVLMSLWNWLLPSLFQVPAITFWQALGLLALSRLLFGGWGRGGRARWARRRQAWRHRMEARMAGLSPEEQEKFRQKLQGACGAGAWMRRKAPEQAQPASAQ